MKKNNRQKKTINKQLQFSLVFKSSIVIIVAIFLLMSGLGLYFYLSNNEINTKISEIEKAIDTEKDIVKAFIIFADSIEDTELTLESDKIKKAHDQSIASLENHVAYLKQVITLNVKFFLIFLGLCIVSLVALMLNIYRISHRIAGPIHLVTKGLQQLSRGEKPEVRALRKKDYCKELYEEYSKLVNNR